MSTEIIPIVDASTIEKPKQFPALASPRNLPSQSFDDMVIMGTVGTY